MFRKNRQLNELPPSEALMSLEQRVADSLSYSDEPGRFWKTSTIRGPKTVIHLGEEMEHRQRGYTLVIPHGDDASVFEVLNNSPFSGYQYRVKDVNGGHPRVAAEEAFLLEPNFSVADIAVGSFRYVKQIIQDKRNLVEPAPDAASLIELGGLTDEQQAEMHLVGNALHAIHDIYHRPPVSH